MSQKVCKLLKESLEKKFFRDSFLLLWINSPYWLCAMYIFCIYSLSYIWDFKKLIFKCFVKMLYVNIYDVYSM